MLPTLLHSINTHLDVMLAPPYPKTQHDRAIWMPNRTVRFPPPVLPMWIPPAWVPRNKDGKGFWLAQRVICHQRGYYPAKLFDQYIKIVATCFEDDVDESMYTIQRLAYDFFIAVVSHDNRVTAGAVVEFRPPVSLSETPYLYISTVCTDPTCGSKGLAHQLVHSVYTLGTLMLEQNATAPGIWQNAIPHGCLDVGLTVEKTPDSDVAGRLEHLYSQCGLRRRSSVKGCTTYRSFTPYSIYQWQMEKQDNKFPMWQSITQGVLYEDGQICILHPTRAEGSSVYHAFPAQHMQTVQSTGIVHPKHTFLYKDPSKIYTPRDIHFSQEPPTEGGAFCIKIQSNMQRLELRISVPAWFASEIRSTTATMN